MYKEDGKYYNDNANSSMFGAWRCRECEYYDRGKCTAAFVRNEDADNEFTRDDSENERAVLAVDEYGDEYVVCVGSLVYIVYCEDDERYHSDYAYCETDGCYYSRDYADRHFSRCSECGNYYDYYDDNFDEERGMCRECARYYSIIGNWHDHKNEFIPIYHDSDDSDTRKLTIGFELEIDHEYYNTERDERAAQALNNLNPRAWVFERDSSLNNGFECILQPHSYAAFKAFDLDSAAKTLREYGYISHNTTTCGLHFHFGVNWFGADYDERRNTLYHVLMFYERHFDKLRALSRRTERGYQSYADCNSNENNWQWLNDIDDVDELVSNEVHGSRYVAVNCTNFYRGDEATIEFRLARGTLRASTIRAWADLHVAIITACRTYGNNTTWQRVIERVDDSTREYINSKLG